MSDLQKSGVEQKSNLMKTKHHSNPLTEVICDAVEIHIMLNYNIQFSLQRLNGDLPVKLYPSLRGDTE